MKKKWVEPTEEQYEAEMLHNFQLGISEGYERASGHMMKLAKEEFGRTGGGVSFRTIALEFDKLSKLEHPKAPQ